MSFVLVRDRSRLGHKPDCRLGWLSEYVRKSMYAWYSVSVACRPAETRRRRGEIGSIRRSILVGHRRPNRRQRVKKINLKKKEKKHKTLYVTYMYLSPWKFFRNQILLDYLGRWRNQSCQIFFQSVHSGVSGKGSNFAIFSANRRWPLQLLYYRTTVISYFYHNWHNGSYSTGLPYQNGKFYSFFTYIFKIL